MDIEYNEIIKDNIIVLKISEDMKNCLIDSITLDKEYNKKNKGKVTKEEYEQYRITKKEIQERYQNILDNMQNMSNISGYYLVNVAKHSEWEADNSFIEFLKNHEQ